MIQNEEKKIRYSFIHVPKEIYKELEGDELKLFLHLMDECEKYEKQHKTYHPNQKNLSKVLGWGLNCKKLKKHINSLLKKELIEVNVGTYLTSDPTASEYHINWKTLDKYRHQKGDGNNMNNYNHRHQNSDATKNLILLNTIYTMEFLKNEFPNGMIPDDYSSDMCDKLVSYLNDRMSERSDNGTTEMNDNISSTVENTINTMECPNPTAASQSQTQNKATGKPKTTEVEQLTTEEKIKRQEARKEEIRLFNAGHDKHRYDMCHNVKTCADFERFNVLLQADIDYVDACDWNDDRKELWHRNYDYWLSKCEDKIMKNYNKILERENRMKKFG